MRFKHRRPVLVSTYHMRLTRKQRNIIKLIVFVIIAFILVISVTSNIQPIVTEMARTKARDIVTLAVNEAVNEKMSDGSLDYEELVTLEKDESGNITALTSNMAKINILQAEIISEVIGRVSEMGTADLKIPFGNIIGGNLLSGRGPGVPIRIISLSTSSASFTSEFISAGINQTKHQIILEIRVDVNILVPGNTTGTEISTDVLVAETIIVGSVPDSYLNIEDILKG